MKIHQILINDTGELPKDFPSFHKSCQDKIKKLYPNEEYHLYSGKELEDIIKSNFNTDVYMSYKKLKPYACKADLARLCLLYIYGGLYLDLNLYLINKIPKLDTLDFFAFRDLPNMSKQSWAVQNGIIYSKPKSKIIKNSIDLIIKHCKQEYYGVQCVDVSATTVLGIGIIQSLPNFNIATDGQLDFFDVNFLSEELKDEIMKVGYKSDKLMGFIMDIDDKIIALRKPSSGGDIESLGFFGTNNYIDMWKSGDVYDKSVDFIIKSPIRYQ